LENIHELSVDRTSTLLAAAARRREAQVCGATEGAREGGP
jgi:hypothetical protein